jgi:hypothetical protein
MSSGKAVNMYVIGSYVQNPPPEGTTLMIADPVYGTPMCNDVVNLGYRYQIPSIVFMWPEDIFGINRKPDQMGFWIKTASAKNTEKSYSRFVEVILFYRTKMYNTQAIHWSNRTGIFNDTVMAKTYVWKKPFSLIQKLIMNHYPGHGTIYDPCAGTGTVHDVCKQMRIPSYSVDVIDRRQG